MMKLNSYQMRAVTHFKGPAVVIAGPGSGKTMVITERIRYLTQKKKVDPASILVVTFTRAAAEEMRQRFVYMSKDSKTRVSFGTFHSVFFTILKYAYGYSASNIAAPRQKEEILRFAMDAAGMDPLPGREDTGEILGEIEKAKGSMMDIGCYYAVSCPEETFRKIYREYTRRMRDSRLIDFEDMMADTYRLLKERPDILAAWQKRFQFILVDEFQDINLLQYRIVRMLAGYEDNLFAVGDDDQSIYGFRGANAGIMLHFTQDYPEAAVLYLPDNFRSRPEIVQAASNLISHNRHRFQKTFRPYRSASPHSVLVRQFRSPYEENAEIVRRIEQLHGNGLPYGQMAVLFRTNTQSRMLVEYLMSRNIPFRLGSRVPDLFNHWIAMDIMAYLHIAQGSRKRRDFLRIINRPNRYISRRMLQDAEIDLAALRNSYESRAWMQERISRLRAMAEKARSIVFFGGAGVSTESGIPDFRSVDGLYNQKYSEPPEEILSHHYFMEKPEEFFRFYRDKMLYPDAQPNAAHLRLAQWEREGRLSAVVTQNIDGLHQKAGSQKVYELHGSVLRNHCMRCGRFYDLQYMMRSSGVPRCDCGGIIKPDVVLYEEGLDERTIRGAVTAISHADLLIIGGTSLAVYPAASFIHYYDGADMVLINRDPTPQDRYASLIIRDPIGQVMEALG